MCFDDGEEVENCQFADTDVRVPRTNLETSVSGAAFAAFKDDYRPVATKTDAATIFDAG